MITIQKTRATLKKADNPITSQKTNVGQVNYISTANSVTFLMAALTVVKTKLSSNLSIP